MKYVLLLARGTWRPASGGLSGRMPQAKLTAAVTDASPDVPRTSTVLLLCTGNAARSVMAGSMLARLADVQGRPLEVVTAGTHAVEGQPMGRRTAQALASVPALDGLPVSRHRSRQLAARDVVGAAVIVAMEADHVRYVRRAHPEVADRAATLRRLVRDLPAGPEPLADRVASLGLATAPLDDGEDVLDPAGHDDNVYLACAAELWSLCEELVGRL